jgi:hypothetical protein
VETVTVLRVSTSFSSASPNYFSFSKLQSTARAPATPKRATPIVFAPNFDLFLTFLFSSLHSPSSIPRRICQYFEDTLRQTTPPLLFSPICGSIVVLSSELYGPIIGHGSYTEILEPEQRCSSC